MQPVFLYLSQKNKQPKILKIKFQPSVITIPCTHKNAWNLSFHASEYSKPNNSSSGQKKTNPFLRPHPLNQVKWKLDDILRYMWPLSFVSLSYHFVLETTLSLPSDCCLLCKSRNQRRTLWIVTSYVRIFHHAIIDLLLTCIAYWTKFRLTVTLVIVPWVSLHLSTLDFVKV
jgi:hypothetical protein